MKALLDTNAYSRMRLGHEALEECLQSYSEIVMSPVVLGELIYGFERGSRCRHNLKELEEFLLSPYVSTLTLTRDTSRRYGQVAARLRAKGRPIPTNDIWVAAQALETGADLISFDEHFACVDGLSWVCP